MEMLPDNIPWEAGLAIGIPLLILVILLERRDYKRRNPK